MFPSVQRLPEASTNSLAASDIPLQPKAIDREAGMASSWCDWPGPARSRTTPSLPNLTRLIYQFPPCIINRSCSTLPGRSGQDSDRPGG